MLTNSCDKLERTFAIISLLAFLCGIFFITILGISPFLQSVFQTSLYITLIIGIFLVIESINKIGIKNFVGKSLLYFGISGVLSLINILLIDFNTQIQINKTLWLVESLLMVAGLYLLLTTYKLNLPKFVFVETIFVFLITYFATSFFLGWVQILNTFLITIGVMAIRISGKRTHCGIVCLSSGLILLAISNILFFYRSWNDISYFGDISDVVLLISWITIVVGIYFTKKYHV
ncbi:MAG: hypothetical protein WC087_02365 [Candidatus Paceibacterota bacterium]